MTPHVIQLQTRLRNFAVDEPRGWGHLVYEAQALEAAGFDRLCVSDHVVFGERLDEYQRPEVGGRVGGRQPTGPDGHWLEPLTTLTFLAARTSRIRLGTLILLAGLRRPIVLAKSLATLDVLSGGRLDVGVGVGWQREEYAAAGLPFETRGGALDQTLEICQLLWREQRASFESSSLKFEAIHMMPKPLQAGGVPIWVSGRVTPAVVRRLTRFGSAWMPWPWDIDQKDLSLDIVRMRNALHDAGRDSSDLRILGVLPMQTDSNGLFDVGVTLESVPRYVECGVTDLHVEVTVPPDSTRAHDLLAQIVGSFRSAVGRQD